PASTNRAFAFGRRREPGQAHCKYERAACLGAATARGETKHMTPATKTTGRVAFVGSGPGDAGLLTVRAQELLAKADVVVTDPDVPSGALAYAREEAEVRPAVGEPGDVAKDLAAEAESGRVVLRLVAGDPLTQPAV